jgi:hypothetical protein
MPRVWRQYGVDANGDGKRSVWDPEDAIAAAAELNCRNLDLVKSASGDRLRNTLAAYNAGYMATAYNGVDPTERVDHFKLWDAKDRVEFDPTGPGVTPAEAWASFQKWADENDYGGDPIPQKVFEQSFKGKYGKYWRRGTAGAIRYEKLKLNG